MGKPVCNRKSLVMYEESVDEEMSACAKQWILRLPQLGNCYTLHITCSEAKVWTVPSAVGSFA